MPYGTPAINGTGVYDITVEHRTTNAWLALRVTIEDRDGVTPGTLLDDTVQAFIDAVDGTAFEVVRAAAHLAGSAPITPTS